MIKLAAKLTKALKGKFNAGAFPPAPDPQAEAAALYNTTSAIKTGYEVLTRTRGEVGDSALLVKEVDYLLELLVAELDTRYGSSVAGATNQENIDAFLADFEHLITQITDHMGNSDIHGGDTTIEEGDTIINEIIQGAPHALWSARHTDVKIGDGGTRQPGQALIVEPDSGQFSLQYPVKWRSIWEFKQYYQGDMVRDQGWLMVAKRPTMERAAPQPSGEPAWLMPETPTWSVGQQDAFITAITQIVMDKDTGARALQLRLDVPQTGASIEYLFEVFIRPGPDGLLHSHPFPNQILVANQWNYIIWTDEPLAKGSLIELHLHSLNVGTTTPIPSVPYIYDGDSQTKEPIIGGWNQNKSGTILRISLTDSDGIDRTTEIQNIVPGSVIVFTQDAAPIANEYTYRITGSGVDRGTSYEFAAVRTGLVGTINKGDACHGGGSAPSPTGTQYQFITDYWLTNQPVWGTASAQLWFDDVEQLGNENTGFSLDIRVEPGVVSDDWDYLAWGELNPIPSEEV